MLDYCSFLEVLTIINVRCSKFWKIFRSSKYEYSHIAELILKCGFFLQMRRLEECNIPLYFSIHENAAALSEILL